MDCLNPPRIRLNALLIPRKKWIRPEWWKDEYDEIPGARNFTEAELKQKLSRRRYNEKHPREELTPQQRALRRAKAGVSEMRTKINRDRARLLLLESLNTSTTLPEWKKITFPYRIANLLHRIPIQEATLARREAELAALKVRTNSP